MSRFRHGRTVLAFVAVIAVFFAVEIFLATKQQRDTLMALDRNQAALDLELMADASYEAVLKHDYVTVRAFVNRWGETHKEYRRISARVPSGFMLAEFRRPAPSAIPGYSLGKTMSLEGQELMTIEVERDFGEALGIVKRLQRQLVVGSIVFSALLGAALWYAMSRMALAPMEMEISLRKKAEEGLETKVLERTAALQQELEVRRRVEAQLLEREEHIRLLLDSMAEGMYGIDTRGKCTFCNPASLKILGYTKETELVGKHLHEMIHHTRPDGSCFREEECGIHSGTEHRDGYHRDNEVFWRADGTSFPVEYWSSPIHQRDVVIGSVVTFLDITDRRKLEAQLRHSQKMEAVGTLAGGVAHDFNNILTAIMGYGELLRVKLGENPLVANVDSMLDAAQRAAHLTKDLLAFSRKQSLAARPVDLNDLIPKASKLIGRLIGEDVVLETVLTGGELPVLADSGQIEQVLMNLATNARDAMPDGGGLRIRSERALIDESHAKAYGYGVPGEYALISVADTGAGMDAQTRDQIFEPFFTTKEVGKGTGLGLATAYGIIKQHSGFINVYSEVGKGTIFRIYLPLIRSVVVRETAPVAATPIPAGTETVLVAEDDPSLRSFAKSLLEEYGYRVVEARDGEEAVRKFQEHRDEIAILLLDIVMPKMNGRKAYEEIRKIRPDIKALFSSGYTADILSVKDIIDEGLNFIQKPMAPRELLGKLRRVLDS